MFTGIVEETGSVVAVETRADIVSVRVRAERVLKDLPQGGSLAVDGCCLTAVRREGDVLTFELTPETMRRTAFGARLRAGARVNLERPLKADGRFDGHPPALRRLDAAPVAELQVVHRSDERHREDTSINSGG